MNDVFEPINAGWSKCPICGRHWEVTPMDDCFVPNCRHYEGQSAGRTNPKRPCFSCGLKHALECRPAPSVNGELIEIEPEPVLEPEYVDDSSWEVWR